LNATQKKYISKRIDETVADKVREATDGKCSIYNDPYHRNNGSQISFSCPSLTDTELNTAIKKAGGIKVMSVADIKKAIAQQIKNGYGVSLHTNPVVNHVKINDEIRKVSEVKTAKLRKVCDKIVARGEELKDEIYLGDEEKALELLKAFRNETF
jgi:hypothetical protein